MWCFQMCGVIIDVLKTLLVIFVYVKNIMFGRIK